VSEQERRRVDAWLRRHKVQNLELTPLVAARIAIRHRCERIKWGTHLALIAIWGVAWVVEGLVNGWSEPEAAPAMEVISISLGFLLLAAITVVLFWLQQRADLRIAQRLRQRVTRSQAVSVATILGGKNLRLLVALYGGGILVGAVAAWRASDTEDRMLARAFVFGLIVCSTIITWLLADTARRPAVADDERSLRADDLLRRMDAREALFPYPTCVAAVAVVAAGGSALLWVFLAYAVASVWIMGYITSPAEPTGVTPGAWT
jgi:hypothetical protein